jgi:hypothetical protein
MLSIYLVWTAEGLSLAGFSQELATAGTILECTRAL